MTTCDDEWENYCNGGDLFENEDIPAERTVKSEHSPKCSDIYISTKTKIGYFSKPIEIHDLFWKIPVIPYQKNECGIIKKQIKISTTDESKITEINKCLSNITNYEIIDLSKKNNTKYVKKISIGLSKKDLVSYRCKKKGAFYNCFVLIFRIKYKNIFKEMHVKIFNTGKIEIPGIKTDDLLSIVLNDLFNLFNNILNLDIQINKTEFETVLINSNFNCGFYIDREKLADILKYKYRLSTSYDPCSYPGIMSKYHCKKEGTDITVSFMIFRTGSILIVGKCDEPILLTIYEFIKKILIDEYLNIYQKTQNDNLNQKLSSKKKKIKRKTITITKQIKL